MRLSGPLQCPLEHIGSAGGLGEGQRGMVLWVGWGVRCGALVLVHLRVVATLSIRFISHFIQRRSTDNGNQNNFEALHTSQIQRNLKPFRCCAHLSCAKLWWRGGVECVLHSKRKALRPARPLQTR